MIQKRLMGSPAGTVLSFLQRNGSATVKELEQALGVTTTAVRQQLTSLLAQGYIEQMTESSGRGRPRHVYTLSTAGHALFPTQYDAFTNTLLGEIMRLEGPHKVASLLRQMGERMAEEYERQMEARAPLERARELIELLNAKGILADLREVDDGLLFREYNCPYYELARTHRDICDMEQGMISRLVQQPTRLVTCTLDGHHGCQFRIELDDNGGAAGHQPN